ncbi:CatB-related O-acetyltransferase [Roseivirga pacifica]|uniref:CatB-related O-acetyltransferase n=1 Tax=Roseivirga pacifica TaxID=1267423 RepID=UPI003BAA82CB
MSVKKYLKLFIPSIILERNRIRKLKKKYHLDDSVKIRGKLSIGGDFSCSEGCRFYGEINISGNIKIGRYTSLNGPNTDMQALHNSIEIGSFCSIARSVSFQEFNHRIDRPSTYFMAQNIFDLNRDLDTNSKGAINVGNDVWIGMHTVVLGGAKIGHGAIIGANSVVNGDIPSYAIAVGSPAKVIGYRFSEEKIKQLLNMAWWDWTIEEIIEKRDFFINAF